jgi:hypothetical protein
MADGLWEGHLICVLGAFLCVICGITYISDGAELR